jgi:hypothetical protein
MNLRLHFAAFCLAALPMSGQAAEPCVRIRTQNGHTCMKFDKAERELARSYGVQLGAPFATVKRALMRQGWQVDRAWLREQSDPGDGRELICGSGYDAVCSTAFVRDGRHAFLTLSATNTGMPLTGISEEE